MTPSYAAGKHRTCGKGVVDTVEGDGVDRVNVFNSLLLQSVALKGVLLLLNFLAGVQVLHGDTAFNWTQNVALEPEEETMKLLPDSV